MIEESIVELDIFEEECKWLACEEPCRDIAVLLEDLQILHGSGFVNQQLAKPIEFCYILLQITNLAHWQKV